MIIFLYGPDSYRSRQKLDEIVGHYKSAKKSGLNLLYIDAVQTEFQDFFHQFNTVSMFAEKKLIILHNLFSNKTFQEDFLKECKKLEVMQDVVVIYEAQEADQRLKLFKTLTKECKSQAFEVLDTKGIKLWAQKELQTLGAKINNDAFELLISYTGSDLWRLAAEMKKLSLFRLGEVIKKDDVVSMVAPNIETDIFKTIDALAQKNKPAALQLLQKHLDAGDAPLYLLSMVAYQFRNLLVVKELAEKGLMYDSIVKKSGLHPFVVKKNYFQCNQFTLEELKKIYERIFAVDLNIKTGLIEPETALNVLLASI